MATTRKLSPKQRRFVDEYLVDLNATQAAIRAGYSAKTAGAQGHALLKKAEIQTAISEATAARQKRVEITADQVVRELGRIALSNVTRIVRQDEQGRVVMRPLAELSEDDAATISEITQLVTERHERPVLAAPGSGIDEPPMAVEVVETVKLRFKTHDKVKALSLLVDHFGLSAPIKLQVGQGITALLDALQGRMSKDAYEQLVEAVAALGDAQGVG